MSIDLNNICRCCLRPGVLKSIFTRNKNLTAVNYYEMIKCCCEFSVMENDGLPAQICTSCLSKLKSSYKFKQKCIESNIKLLNLKAAALKHEKEDLKMEKFNESNEVSDCNDEILVFENNKNKHYDYELEDIKTEIIMDTSYENNQIKAENHEEFVMDEFHKNYVTKKLPEENIVEPRTMESNKKIENKAESNESKRSKSKKKSSKLECETCGQYFYKSSTLQDHINWKHYGIKKYHCSICNEDYMKEKQHRELHENTFSATCDQCGKVYTSRRHYEYHMESHGNQEYICECGATFKAKSFLRRHMSGVHAPKKFMCQFCSKGFTMRGYLTLHMRKHTGEKPFECQLCQKRFRIHLMLKRHIQGKHSDVRSYQCQTCHKRFKTGNVLAKHMVVHAETRQYKCRLCQKPFGRVDNRNVHERSVHALSREQQLMWPS